MKPLQDKIKEYLKTHLNEEEFKRALEFKKLAIDNSKGKQIDETLVESAALLYHIGIDRVFDVSLNIGIPLGMTQKICQIINPQTDDTIPERLVIEGALMLMKFETIEGDVQ
ncbi:hypothetical protein JW930_05630 [Candidatus Woesearchaeota archaeon]|nr:hypothetical protein [Candidatus Woesearchaeota archaeon]